MPRMGDLAATDVYSAFDVPLDQGTNVGWANRMGEILTARPQYDETVQYTTASPLVSITEGDIGRATEAALGGMTVTPKGIKAYHSSPHDFDKFDLAKIGSGEGAQAYGHGLYFAESPKVSGQGGEYWKQFLPRFKGEEGAAARVLSKSDFDRDFAIKNLDERISEAADHLKYSKTKDPLMAEMDRNYYQQMLDQYQKQREMIASGNPVGPRTYEVEIKADPAHMLDWDKPLSQQSSRVQDVASRLSGERMDDLFAQQKQYGIASPHDTLTGEELYRGVGQKWMDDKRILGLVAEHQATKEAASMLREAGIPGIKYLDQGSRGKGTGSSNYVIFNPELIDILKKYGIAGVAPTAMGALAAQDRYQGER